MAAVAGVLCTAVILPEGAAANNASGAIRCGSTPRLLPPLILGLDDSTQHTADFKFR